MFVQGAMDVIEDKQKTKAELLQELDTSRERVSGLKQAVEEWSKTFDATPGLVFVQDKDFRFVKVNKFVCDLLKVKPEDLIGKKCYEVLHKSDKPWPNCPMVKTLKDKRPHKQEVYDSNIGIPLLITTSPIFDENGELTSVVHIATDITERKRTEDELKESEERFRTIFDNAPVGLLVADAGSKKIYTANKMFCQMLGYNREELENLGIADIHPKKDLPYVIEQFEKQARRELTLNRDLPVERKDGSVFYADINSFPITLAGESYLMGVFRDITERKKTEEALRKNENKYRTLLENLPQKIFLKDKNSVYVSCNDNLARDFKIKSEEITGKTDYDLVPKALADKYKADDKRIIESGETEAIEEKYIEDGQERIIHTVKTPVKDERGNVIGVLGIFRDITELKRKEEELNIYRENMVQAEELASLGTLSATVAHELTQPLTVIHLSIENALEKLEATSSPETVTRKLKDSLTEISNITSIVDRFRNFARKSSEEIVGEIDLKAIAKRIVKLLNENARRAEIVLSLNGMDKLPLVYSNEKDMEQLFFALVDNAIQAADGKKSRQLIISGAVKNEYIELSFSDNCGGIAPENIDKIFEQFFTTKPKGQGTGLGLCVVQSIVSRAGGKIRVESKFGEGSTFFVTLPTNKTMRS